MIILSIQTLAVAYCTQCIGHEHPQLHVDRRSNIRTYVLEENNHSPRPAHVDEGVMRNCKYFGTRNHCAGSLLSIRNRLCRSDVTNLYRSYERIQLSGERWVDIQLLWRMGEYY